MKSIVDAFIAINVNGLSHLLCVMFSNWWFFLIAFGAIASIVMSLKEEIISTVKEEQQIL